MSRMSLSDRLDADEIATCVERQELLQELEDIEDLVERMKDRAARLMRQIAALDARTT